MAAVERIMKVGFLVRWVMVLVGYIVVYTRTPRSSVLVIYIIIS